MKIEGYEIPWLDSLSETQMDKFEQMIIVFYSPFSEHEKNIFRKINKTHVLIHFHGNNKHNMKLYKGKLIPNVFECTYLHKKYFNDGKTMNETPIPSSLDMPNKPNANEIYINYEPFVKKGERKQMNNCMNNEDTEDRVFFYTVYMTFFLKKEEKEFLVENVKKWVVLDTQIKMANEKIKSMREMKMNLTHQICNFYEENNMKNKKIGISDGELQIFEKKEYSPLTFGYIEKVLKEVIKNEEHVHHIIELLKKNREIKTNSDIRRKSYDYENTNR